MSEKYVPRTGQDGIRKLEAFSFQLWLLPIAQHLMLKKD
jgi:hypothetical protein